MAMHNCPKCKQRGFTWFDDPDVSKHCCWSCSKCGYFATDDESLVSDCLNCGKEQGTAVLVDSTESYRYCFACCQRSSP